MVKGHGTLLTSQFGSCFKWFIIIFLNFVVADILYVRVRKASNINVKS